MWSLFDKLFDRVPIMWRLDVRVGQGRHARQLQKGMTVTASTKRPWSMTRIVLNGLILLLVAISICCIGGNAPVGVAICGALVILCCYFKHRFKASLPPWQVVRLHNFIMQNGLYESERVEVGSGTRERIRSSACFEVQMREPFLYVLARDRNDRYTSKMLSLERDLPSLLEMPLERVEHDFKGATYILRMRPVERLHYSLASFMEKPQGKERYRISLNGDIAWDCSKNPHALIGGGTGSGKSYSMYGLVLQLLSRSNAEVFICDPKQSDLSMLRFALGADHVASTAGQIARNCRYVLERMQERYQLMGKPENFGKDFSDLGLDPIVLVFDEVAAFRAMCSSGSGSGSGDGRKVMAEVDAAIKAIVLQGRQAGCEVVLAMQQPNAEAIGGTDVRDNLGMRLLMGNDRQGFLTRVFFGDAAVELQSCDTKGAGHVYLDGLGWESPRYVEMPTFPPDFDFMEAFKAVAARNPYYAHLYEVGGELVSEDMQTESESEGVVPVAEIAAEVA